MPVNVCMSVHNCDAFYLLGLCLFVYLCTFVFIY